MQNGRRTLMADVLAAVSQASGISKDRLKGRQQNRQIAWPRQVAMLIMHQECHHATKTMIGWFFSGRDRTTIGHGIEVTPEHMGRDWRLLSIKRRAIEILRTR